MMEAVSLVVRWAHAGTSVVLLGTFALLALAPRESLEALSRWRRQWYRISLSLAIVVLLLSVAMLVTQASTLAHGNPLPATISSLLRESRLGHVLSVRIGLTLALIALLALKWRVLSDARYHDVMLASLAGAIFALIAWAGHSAAEEPAGPALTAHVMHLVALGLWLGALPALYRLVATLDRSESELAIVSRTFWRFSKYAMLLMCLIVVSGTGLAIVHVRRWPALLGTSYGATVLLKISLLLGILFIAAKIRWRLLPSFTNSTKSLQLKRWLRFEILLGFSVLIAGATLAQTIPARHDAITWVFPFRFSIDAASENPQMRDLAWTASIIALVAIVIAAGLWLTRRRVLCIVAGLTALVGTITTLWALSVQAYSQTYQKPSVAFLAESVARGSERYAQHCVSCHSNDGRGSGPVAASLNPPPANLTEPHTALHTAGDIFRWLSEGKPPGAMPGFAAQLSEDDRWDVINYLRTLSVGYQARIISERVVPEKPWLGAIDFDFVDQDERSGTLQEYRERDVVLLIVQSGRTPDTQRLRQLREALEHNSLHSVAVIVASTASSTAASDALAPIRVITDGREQIVTAYALLRRSLQNADPDNTIPIPDHMEFLIDRYGYVRARWNPQESDTWRNVETLQQQVTTLTQEKKIREPPEDHVH